MTISEPAKVKGVLRVGLLLASPSGAHQFKPAANIGIMADGGVFVTPYPKGDRWTYGTVRSTGPTDREHVTTGLTPKLNYHRSGVVAVSMTGQPIERRRLCLRPLEEVQGAQILSVTTVRTSELPTRAGRVDKGDFLTRVDRWPDIAGWGISLLAASAAEREQIIDPELGALGILPGRAATHGVVSLAAYGREAVLLITVSIQDRVDLLPEGGGTTVAALGWRPSGPEHDDEAFALWNAGLRNPVIRYEPHMPANLRPEEGVTIRTHSIDDWA